MSMCIYVYIYIFYNIVAPKSIFFIPIELCNEKGSDDSERERVTKRCATITTGEEKLQQMKESMMIKKENKNKKK